MELEKASLGKDAEKEKSDAKKGRHRRKHKFNSIRAQMEFYFSDANLTKDRYLGQLVRNDPFIPLEEFLKFNKIKALTTNADDIANSIKNSNLIELSEDRTKVRRKTELTVKENCEECTIYVESLPPKANHDWVRNVFSGYGKVAYVSLPKFKHSRKIKEFGFIEFEEESSVQKALKAFETFGGVLAYETTDPAKMASIKTYEQDKNEQEGTDNPEPEKQETSEVEVQQLGSQSIVLPSASENDPEQDDGGGEPAAKRHKIEPASEDEEDTQDFPQIDQEENACVKHENKLVPESTSDDEVQAKQNEIVDKNDAANEKLGSTEQDHITEIDLEGGRKKCRQRKGSSIIKKELQLDDKVYELKIMTKKEWRRLRNKYLNLQKQEAKKLKRLFVQTGKHHQRHPKTVATTVTGGIAMKSIKSSPRVNFYGAMPIDDERSEENEVHLHQQEQSEESAALAKKPLFSFEPGLIVSVKFREPCVDVKDFRSELRQYSYVKYIDVKEGEFEAFVRVDKPASANALVKEYNSAEHSAQILSGELEQQYWDKMMRDREDKLNKRVKTERVRGRTKLIRKINNHIKFDDDDD
ncbi:la-related protein 7 [Anopheles nili]|uniref:la-related protein 7 n=1 Tax=Anopheles nili TaxID=185578 RepID=UPI00237B1C30|nr:la-related protein 7 [Anopheles nili]